MGYLQPTESIDVVDGANPDTVAPSLRRWRISPLRIRNGSVAPDYTDDGVDLRLLGDPLADGDAVTVTTGIADATRNGAKRVYDSNGNPALWAEAAPQSYDTAGVSAGVAGVAGGPAASSGNTIDLGVAASHTITNNGDYPLVVRPVISVVGVRYDYPAAATAVGSPPVTCRATIATTVDAGSPTEVFRDLWFGFGGSTEIVRPAQVVAVGGGQLDVECDLQLIYRQDVAEAFEWAVAGVQVLFQVIEYTSQGG